MSLTTLPLLPLEKVTSYLDFDSLASLAASHSSLAHVQPSKQIVYGADLLIKTKNWQWQKDGGCRDPETCLEVEVKTRGLLGIKMVWEWEGLVSR